MTPFQAILLGVLQGLTEFLPVSSSGHLVLAQSFIKDFTQPGVLFDAALHAGTMLAIIIYFRRQILSISRNMAGLLVIGTIPAALMGVLFQSQLEALFTSVRVVGVALLFTGVMNFLVDRSWKTEDGRRKTEIAGGRWKMDGRKALMVGVFQALAIIPGISRSGSTIFAGVAQGIKREEAAVFSFLLSVPAVLGAVGLQLFKYGGSYSVNYLNYLLGSAFALLVGYLSISVLMKLLLRRRFRVFAVYCFMVAALALFLA